MRGSEGGAQVLYVSKPSRLTVCATYVSWLICVRWYFNRWPSEILAYLRRWGSPKISSSDHSNHVRLKFGRKWLAFVVDMLCMYVRLSPHMYEHLCKLILLNLNMISILRYSNWYSAMVILYSCLSFARISILTLRKYCFPPHLFYRACSKTRTENSHPWMVALQMWCTNSYAAFVFNYNAITVHTTQTHEAVAYVLT